MIEGCRKRFNISNSLSKAPLSLTHLRATGVPFQLVLKTAECTAPDACEISVFDFKSTLLNTRLLVSIMVWEDTFFLFCTKEGVVRCGNGGAGRLLAAATSCKEGFRPPWTSLVGERSLCFLAPPFKFDNLHPIVDRRLDPSLSQWCQSRTATFVMRGRSTLVHHSAPRWQLLVSSISILYNNNK